MKLGEIDIANFLSAYDVKTVKKGIRLWSSQYVVTKGSVIRKLKEDGWYPVGKSKPKGVEYYYIFDEYWVQDPKRHEELVRKRLEEEREVPSAVRMSKTDLSDIRITELRCPICDGELFRQRICPGCTEGKQGYRVRLICGEDADHEFLV